MGNRKGNKPGHCWCGEKLISGIVCEDGSWFPFGFANCPTHKCWYEYNDRLEYERVMARRKKRAKEKQMERLLKR